MRSTPPQKALIRADFHDHFEKREFLLDMHNVLEIGVVCQGRMQRQYPGWHSDLGPGEVWLCGMCEPHSCRVLRTPCRVLVFMIEPQALSPIPGRSEQGTDLLSPFFLGPHQRPQISKTDQKEMLYLAQRCENISARHEKERDYWIQLMVQELLLILQRSWHPPERGTRKSPLLETYHRLNHALQMVFQSQRFISSEEAGRACAMSRNGFDRAFKSLMGLSFAKFSLAHRLRGAAVQLVRTDLPPKQIALESGFTDLSHLHHAFSRYYGCTPGEYRIRAKYQELPG